MGFLIIILIITFILAYFLNIFSSKEKQSFKKIDDEFLKKAEIIFLPHAIERIIQRDISQEEVRKIIFSKNSHAEAEKNGRVILSNGEISIICKFEGNKIKVITVYLNN